MTDRESGIAGCKEQQEIVEYLPLRHSQIYLK